MAHGHRLGTGGFLVCSILVFSDSVEEEKTLEREIDREGDDDQNDNRNEDADILREVALMRRFPRTRPHGRL